MIALAATLVNFFLQSLIVCLSHTDLRMLQSLAYALIIGKMSEN